MRAFGGTRRDRTLLIPAICFGLLLSRPYAVPAEATAAQPQSAPVSTPPPPQPIPQSAQSGSSAPAVGAAPTPAALQERRLFEPRFCDSFVPPGARFAPNAATTFFSYTLTLAGDVRDIALFGSSGNPDLDRAALACASAWHGKPRTVSGSPEEVSWVGMVTWNWRWHQLFMNASLDGKSRSCLGFFPPLAVRLSHHGTTVVRFQIGPDGAVNELSVSTSSGYKELDAATLQCIASWKYFPARQNGQPVSLDETMGIDWMKHL